MTAVELRDRLGHQTWTDCYTFCFERNPWDRLVSFYHWRTKSMQSPPPFKDFAVAALSGTPQQQAQLRAKYFSNRPFYLIDGELAVDFVGRFENLEADLATVCRRIGLPWDGTLPRAKSGIRPGGRDYRHYYDPQLRELCEREFSLERDLFGYQF